MKTILHILIGFGLTLAAAGCALSDFVATQSSVQRPLATFGVVGPTHAQTLQSSVYLHTTSRINADLPAEIQGEVFVDENGNGQRDQGEPGLPRIRVLLPGNGVSQTSNTQGEFAFDGISPGQQAVSLDELTIPNGYHLTTAATIPIFLSEGARGFAEFGVQEEPPH